MPSSQDIAKKVSRKLVVTPIDRPAVELACGIEFDVLSEIPQIDFIKVTTPKLPPPQVDPKSEIMKKVLESIGGK